MTAPIPAPNMAKAKIVRPKKSVKVATNKPDEQNKTKMKKIVEQMKRPEPIIIKLADGKECLMPADMLARMQDGDKLTQNDWKRITDLLLPKYAPNAVVALGTNCTLPPLQNGESGIWLRQMSLRGGRRTMVWSISTYGHPENAVNVYCVRGVTGMQENLEPVAGALGVAEYMIHSTYYQETGFMAEKHVPYEDAILLDMLLDIAAGDFTPHQRKITDGSGIQLEILQALEVMQKDTESASAATPKKRRMTIQQRINAKKVKTES